MSKTASLSPEALCHLLSLNHRLEGVVHASIQMALVGVLVAHINVCSRKGSSASEAKPK